MFGRVQENTKCLIELKPVVTTVGLETKTPLEKGKVLQGLQEIQKVFPELTEVQYDKEDDVIGLGNDETDYAEGIQLVVNGCTRFYLSWGLNTGFGSKEAIARYYDYLHHGFSLLPINIKLIDVRMHFLCERAGHHYKAIWEAFFSQTALGTLFEPNDILQDDLELRSLLPDGRMAVVIISSNIDDAEVKKNRFKDDTLRTIIGIAATGPFLPDGSLSECMMQHSKYCDDFISNKFVPSVLLPLDEALIHVLGEKG